MGKLYFNLVLLTAVALLLNSCGNDNSVAGPRGPQGPAGPPGIIINTIEFQVYGEDWVAFPDEANSWFVEFQTNLVNQNVMNNGFVLFYIKDDFDEFWKPLPDTYMGHTDTGQPYTLEYRAWYGLGLLEFDVRDSGPGFVDPPPGPVVFKAVIAEGNNYYAKMNLEAQLKGKNYNQAMKIIKNYQHKEANSPVE